MRLLSSIINGFGEVWSHKMRSFLSLVAVMLGVVSVVVISGLVDGMFHSWQQRMVEEGGMEIVSIGMAEVPPEQEHLKISPRLPGMKEKEVIEKLAFLQNRVSLDKIQYQTPCYYKGKRSVFNVRGTMPAGFYLHRYIISEGYAFSDLDVQRGEPVAVIGANVAKAFFPEESPVGKIIRIKGQLFRVVGVFKEYKEQAYGYNILEWKNRWIFIPITAMQQRFKQGGETSVIMQARDIGELDDLKDQLYNTMLSLHQGLLDFQVNTKEQDKANFEKFKGGYVAVGMGVGGVSLLIGAIGIMNLMLASINERIREIGIRKALGAWNRDLFFQFLTESVVISLLGGLFGVVASKGVITILQKIMVGHSPPLFSFSGVMLGLGFSVVIGIFAGIYPAFRAARMDPIEALRYE